MNDHTIAMMWAQLGAAFAARGDQSQSWEEWHMQYVKRTQERIYTAGFDPYDFYNKPMDTWEKTKKTKEWSMIAWDAPLTNTALEKYRFRTRILRITRPDGISIEVDEFHLQCELDRDLSKAENIRVLITYEFNPHRGPVLIIPREETYKQLYQIALAITQTIPFEEIKS